MQKLRCHQKYSLFSHRSLAAEHQSPLAIRSIYARLTLSVVSVKLCLAMVQYWLVTDGQTDEQTHDDSLYCASIASCAVEVEANNVDP